MIGEQNNGQVLVLVPSTSLNLLVSIKQTYQLYEFFDIISLEGVAAPKQKDFLYYKKVISKDVRHGNLLPSILQWCLSTGLL